ncbi:hypothetical protein scyTo_0018039, partial [Scyliorhinus torazame]|nr:hypothetical protein [Scyliorhinus torazame]
RRFLNRPQMCEAVNRARICSENHKHQKALCQRCSVPLSD